MTELVIKREYEHKEYGAIGVVNLKVDFAKVELNGVELPVGAVEYLMTFALQTFQDAYAGAKDLDEATGNFDKKIARVQKDQIGTRVGGVSEEQKVGRTIVREMIAAGKTKLTKEDFGKLDDEAKVKKLDEILGKNLEKLAPVIAGRIKKMAELRAAKKAEQKGLELDI